MEGGPSSVDGVWRLFYPLGEGLAPSSFFFDLMKIRVLFFASYRDLLGVSEVTLEFPGPVTVAHLVSDLRSENERFARLPGSPATAVNEEYVPAEAVLHDGDVVAFIPPVAGG